MSAYLSADDCVAVETHAAHPQGYLAHYDWAQRMLKTHRQTKCPTCGFWAIWTPRKISSHSD